MERYNRILFFKMPHSREKFSNELVKFIRYSRKANIRLNSLYDRYLPCHKYDTFCRNMRNISFIPVYKCFSEVREEMVHFILRFKKLPIKLTAKNIYI